MFNPAGSVSNLSHQLIQRENNFRLHGEPRLFATHLYRERLRLARNLYKTDLKGHFGCVNAIEFSHGGQFLASGGDDKRVLVWDIEKSLTGLANPRALTTEQSSNIFCLGFDSQNRKLISGGNDALAISHDFETGKLDNVFKHEEPVYGLSIDPQNDHIFATASENGVVLLFDQRTDPSDPLVVASLSSSFHAVEFHPHMSHLLVTANSKRGAALYDVRKPREPVIQYVNLGNLRSCMSVRFNKTGNLILGLRRRLTPVLYSINSPDRICTFYHSYYYNSCTMKSCTFAGEDDELVISGSDDFNLYVWRLSDINVDAIEQWVETTQMVLYGHRSIVNQVRYNREKCLLASSGVEKIVKIWSPFSQYNWSGSLTMEATCSENPRELYSPYNLFTMALPENWHHLSHDYSSENTNEDPRMMAFFDSLIQQEIEGWDTESTTTENSNNEEQSNTSLTHSSCQSSSSSSSSSSSISDSTSSSSSSSSSSSDSDSDNENHNKLNTVKRKRCFRQAKRKTKQRQWKERTKQQNKKLPRTIQQNLSPSQVPPNRIAYLISKKRNTLRRLAIKGSLLDKRRSHKMVVVVNGREKCKSRVKQTKKQSSPKRRSTYDASNSHNVSSNESCSNSNSSDKPSTSKAAATLSVTSHSSSSQNNASNMEPARANSGSNYSSGEDTGNNVRSSSSRSNAANISSSSNNANIPSTSTGITSNFRDAFLRLSRQIFMSDSEDDTDGGNNDRKKERLDACTYNELESSRKKLNGANKAPSTAAHEDICENKIMSETVIRTSNRKNRLRPKTSAALNVTNTNKPALPQENAPTTDSQVDLNLNLYGSRSSSRNSANSEIDSIGDDSQPDLPYNTRTLKKRTCQEYDLAQEIEFSPKYSSNPSHVEHMLSSPSSSPSTSLSAPSLISLGPQAEQSHTNISTSFTSSPLKKRKISISDYIKVRTPTDLQELEENNNETNNNDIFASENNNSNANGEVTPQRALSNNNSFTSYLNESNSSAYLFTPDSGVSLNSSLATPSTICYNDSHRASTSHSTRVASQLSPCYEDNGIDEAANAAAAPANNVGSPFSSYEQKLARVRRNYRKQFLDDTESD